MTPIGSRITASCKSLGISRAELSRRVKMTPQHLQQVCDGRVKESKHFPEIARTLGVHVEWLTTGSPIHQPDWFSSAATATSNLATHPGSGLTSWPAPLPADPPTAAPAPALSLQARVVRQEAALAELAEQLAAERAARIAAEHARRDAEKALAELLAQRTARTAAARHDLTWEPAGPSTPSPARPTDGRLGSDDAGNELEHSSAEPGPTRSPRRSAPVRTNPRGER